MAKKDMKATFCTTDEKKPEAQIKKRRTKEGDKARRESEREKKKKALGIAEEKVKEEAQR